MRMWTRTAGFIALVGALTIGCVDESDHPATAEGAAPAEAHGTAPAADPTAKSTTVNATLAEWTVTLSETAVDHGTVSFEVRNNGTEDHAFEIEGSNQEWKTEPIKPGESATLSVALAAGSYNVYCPIASGGESHADRGMKTVLTVR